MRSRTQAACSATPSGARWRRRRSSGGGSRGSCTTRPGQALTSILLGLAGVEAAKTADEAHAAAAELRTLVVETLQDVRRLAVELRPSALDDFGLEPALRRLGQSVREAGGLDVQVETTLSERLAPDVETAVYRIVQEALTNVVKHADAARVSIVVSRKPDSVLVMIEDDGRGFDPAHVGRRRPRPARDARTRRAARRVAPGRGCARAGDDADRRFASVGDSAGRVAGEPCHRAAEEGART